jgi:peptide-methionine (R)-S-oxide reductase
VQELNIALRPLFQTNVEEIMTAGVSRRALLIGGALCVSTISRSVAAARVEIEQFDANGVSTGVASLEKIVKSDAEWRAQLSPRAYDVMRHEGTERAFTGPYWDDHADGLYRCLGCETALFDSKTKFDSGTGWPSFIRPLAPAAIEEKTDLSHGMERTEVRSKPGKSHLGHVFPDGPAPTGLRYCINSAALRFIPAEDLEKEGYAKFKPLFATTGKE